MIKLFVNTCQNIANYFFIKSFKTSGWRKSVYDKLDRLFFKLAIETQRFKLKYLVKKDK